jgi:two-component system, NtrC family, nitrogen regulation sensor histidine kinase NtrY
LPKLNCSTIAIESLFEHVTMLLRDALNKESIQLHTEIFPANLTLTADKALLEQVLINLIQNAVDAMNGFTNKKITLKAYKSFEDQIIIEVIDNGSGIDNTLMDEIFIPFFTTKENGSGIGLSLASQIMRLHNGKITANSKPGEKTVFRLEF